MTMADTTAGPADDTPHAHALAYARLGLRVLPIRPGGKHPPFNSWQHAATDNPATIDNWYRGLYTTCGVGIALGPQPCGANLFALDIDVHGDGDGHDDLAALEHEHGPLPDTWRSITGADGGHIILDAGTGTVRNQQAHGNRVAPNIDVRGAGGQIVVAPTTHPDTLRKYAWEHGYEPWTIPVAPAPAWLLELVGEREPAPTPEASGPTRELHTRAQDSTLFDLHRDTWDWATELNNTGWQIARTDPNGDQFWTRPGKDPRAGHSAVLHSGGPLVVWTTDLPAGFAQAGSRTVDGSGLAFGPFAFYAAQHHHGDRSAAYRALCETYGYEPATSDPVALLASGTPVPLTGTLTCDPIPLEGTNEQSDDAALRAMWIDWDTFADTDHNIAEWLWEPIIPMGRASAIFAKGGTGKSLVTLRMVLDIVQHRHRILYLDYEMTPEDLDDRLSEMHVDPRSLKGFLYYAQLPPIDPLDTVSGARHIRRMAELADVEHVIIDTFARAVEGEENDNDTVRRFYNNTGIALKADRRGYTRLDHAGKDAAKGMRGASGKNDDVDLVWELRAGENGYTFIRGKTRMGWVPERVELERHDNPYRLTVAGGPVWPKGTAEMARALDEAGISPDMSANKAVRAFREAGGTGTNQVVRAAQKYRRQELDRLLETGTARSTARYLSTGHGAPDGAVADETTNPQLDTDPARSTARDGAPADADTARCAPPKGAHPQSVTPEPTPEPVDNSTPLFDD